MNRRHFMRTIGGVVAGAVGIGAMAKAAPPTPKPDFTFKGVPMWWQGLPNAMKEPTPEEFNESVRKMTHFLRQTRRQHGIIIQEVPDTPVADMLEANHQITIRGGSQITPRIKGIQA